MMEEIQSKVIQIISEQLGKDAAEIQMNSHFIEDLDADSNDTVGFELHSTADVFGVDGLKGGVSASFYGAAAATSTAISFRFSTTNR